MCVRVSTSHKWCRLPGCHWGQSHSQVSICPDTHRHTQTRTHLSLSLSVYMWLDRSICESRKHMTLKFSHSTNYMCTFKVHTMDVIHSQLNCYLNDPFWDSPQSQHSCYLIQKQHITFFSYKFFPSFALSLFLSVSHLFLFWSLSLISLAMNSSHAVAVFSCSVCPLPSVSVCPDWK